MRTLQAKLQMATGSTEQAATVEELNTSIMKVTERAQKNLKNVNTATEYSRLVYDGISTGNQYMQELPETMKNIDAASSQISNITKTIEDIAFQTNILMHNTEGSGKGFSVSG